MEVLIKTARIFYGLMIAGLAIQQCFYGEPRPVILPPWLPVGATLAILTYILSIALVLVALAIIFDKAARTVSLVLGGVFLLLFIMVQIPYQLIVDSFQHLASWGSALKELALSGGAFAVAGSYTIKKERGQPLHSPVSQALEKILPFSSIFFCTTMILFGIEHFLYADFVKMLVPTWVPPSQIFWTYFAAAALIGSGIAIVLAVKLQLSAILLALMIFLWFVMLHIPRAVADPYGLKGNEVSSVFEALGFSGIAYLLAYQFKS